MSNGIIADKPESDLPVCDCTSRCCDDPDVYRGKAGPCKLFVEKALRDGNAATARRLLKELGVIDQYDGAGLVAALTELRGLRTRASGLSPVQH